MAENLYDIPTARRRTGREVFGDIREGFAAGLVGRDPRFSREQRQSKLTQATLQDAQALQQALASNNQRQAIDLLVDRANLLESMGEDASDTYALRDMIVQGNTRGAMGEVGTFLDAAKRRGLVSTPAPLESKYLTTDPSGRMGTVIPDTSGGYRFQEAIGAGTPKPEEPETYTGSDGIERYATGKYAGYSVGAIADMMRQGQIATFGDAIPRATQPQQATVRPPMRMPEAPAGAAATTAAPAADEYAGLSAQEIAILDAEKEEKRLERERAAAEEERRVAQEDREVKAAGREEAEATEKEALAKNEALMALGLLRGRLLNPAVYDEDIFAAATGPYEGTSEGASWTSYLPFGASPAQTQNFIDDFDNLNNLLTVGGLGRMSGVLSESDIRLIRDAASGLKRTSDPQLVKARMIEIERVIANRLKEKFNLSDAEIMQQLPRFSTQGEGALDQAINRLNALGVTG